MRPRAASWPRRRRRCPSRRRRAQLDYRYCWLRDASLTLDALLIGAYVDEARGFRDWLVRHAGAPAGCRSCTGSMGSVA
jgi:hypothetical protein